MRVRAAVLEECGRPAPYADSRPLSIGELELDAPGAGELLVRIAAAGVCHSDLSVVDGSRPRPTPMALGHEAAGVVEAVGPGVDDVRPGEHVVLIFLPSCGLCADCAGGRPMACAVAARANAAGTLLGGGRRLHRDGADVHHHIGVSAFAERTVVSRRSVVPVGDDVPLETAALFGCAVLTGVGAVLNAGDVRPGDSVAVFGLGGVGLAAVMGAVVAGAGPLVAVDPVAGKRELALELGATHAFGPEAAVERIREAAGGGVRVAIEAVGSAAVLRAAYDATRLGGRTVTVGLPAPGAELTIPALSLTAEARTLTGSLMGSAVPHRDIPTYVDLWRAGRLPVERLASGTLPLERVNEAMDALAGGQVVRQVLVP